MNEQLKADLKAAIEAATGVKGWVYDGINHDVNGDYHQFILDGHSLGGSVVEIAAEPDRIFSVYDYPGANYTGEPFNTKAYVDVLTQKGY